MGNSSITFANGGFILVVPEGEEGEEAAAEAPKEEEAKADKPESEDLGAKQLEGSTLEIFRPFMYIFLRICFYHQLWKRWRLWRLPRQPKLNPHHLLTSILRKLLIN